MRWWNVKHPAAYQQRLAAGLSPAHGRELLTDSERHLERVLLELRLVDGLRAGRPGRRASGTGCPGWSRRGLVVVDGDRLVLTREGRLLADGVVRHLLDD